MPSNKALHKLTKVHGTGTGNGNGNEGSHADLKKLGKNASSSTNLKKNSSHVSLKRNRSSADVKRPKSSEGSTKRPTSVHFEIGDQEDAWEEASSSASPALSRAPSRSGQSSSKHSANNSRPQSPLIQSPSTKSHPPSASTNGAPRSQTADAKVITERLLNRVPSTVTTTKMSLATATPSNRSPDSPAKSHTSTLNGTPRVGSKEEVVSRFVSGSGTPSENSPFLQHAHQRIPDGSKDEVKRAQSMGNLTRHDSSHDDDSESALKPRSRKSSTTQHPYNPPQQSRTQQKLWLQRASSNIEPAQMATGVAMNGLGLSGALVGAGYDGPDPRIKLQLERTGLEYLVVRRHQDPVGLALKRLNQLPGAEKYRRIPAQSSRKGHGGTGSYGLSQSLKDSRARNKTTNGARSSYEEQSVGSQDSGIADRGGDDDGVGAILRSMWEKSYDLSASQD